MLSAPIFLSHGDHDYTGAVDASDMEKINKGDVANIFRPWVGWCLPVTTNKAGKSVKYYFTKSGCFTDYIATGTGY
jgi:hypothetical protein